MRGEDVRSTASTHPSKLLSKGQGTCAPTHTHTHTRSYETNVSHTQKYQTYAWFGNMGSPAVDFSLSDDDIISVYISLYKCVRVCV